MSRSVATLKKNLDELAGGQDELFDYIRLRAGNGRFIDLTDEWHIIDNAVFNLGLLPLHAKSLIVGAAVINDYTLESLIDQSLLRMAEGIKAKSGKISKSEFAHMVHATRAMSRGHLSKEDAEDKVKTACDTAELKVGRAGVLRGRRWYRRAGNKPKTTTA